MARAGACRGALMVIDQTTVINGVFYAVAIAWGISEKLKSWRAGARERVSSDRAREATDRAREATEESTRLKAAQAYYDEAIRAKTTMVETLVGDRDAWKVRHDEEKVRFEAEHAEYVKYREDTHERSKPIQLQILKLTEDNAELRAKTDFTPIVKFAEKQEITNQQQAATNQKIVTQLGSVEQQLNAGARLMAAMCDRLNIPQQPHSEI